MPTNWLQKRVARRGDITSSGTFLTLDIASFYFQNIPLFHKVEFFTIIYFYK
jgi:hypothetical protein